ncbi:MAG: trypsin-like peptidase domain-containing protein [Leadbetterella sp.]|nr:trypsin-like peptidase domain-containing protein [Leadbetterella sp.]
MLQAQGDLEPVWKTIVITLFVLSMISERLANFLKLNLQVWFPDPRRDPGYYAKASPWRQRLGRKLKLKNLMRVEEEEGEEKERVGGIINLAIFCGILVAIMANADFFYLLSTGHTRSMYWEGVLPWDGWVHTLNISKCDFWLGSALFWKKVAGRCIGWMLTGLFVSLGSKFWHDLLDLLLYSSNLKRKLSDPNTFTSGSADEVREFAELTSREFGQMALAQQGERLQSQPGVLDVVFGKKRVKGAVRDVLIVYVNTASTVGQLPASAEVQLVSGRKVKVPVVYEVVDDIPSAQFSMGDSLHLWGSKFTGTLGCIFKGRDPDTDKLCYFALTCSHVLTANEKIDRKGWIEDPSDTVQVSNHALGKWRYGQLNREFDIALVTINPEQVKKYKDPLAVNLQPRVRHLTEADISRQIILSRYGTRDTRLSSGKLSALLESEIQIRYGSYLHGIAGLIQITNSDGGTPKAISSNGDSGSLVYDDDGLLVGIIVAGNESYSYAIPMATIERKFRTILPDFEIIILPNLSAL